MFAKKSGPVVGTSSTEEKNDSHGHSAESVDNSGDAELLGMNPRSSTKRSF